MCIKINKSKYYVIRKYNKDFFFFVSFSSKIRSDGGIKGNIKISLLKKWKRRRSSISCERIEVNLTKQGEFGEKLRKVYVYELGWRDGGVCIYIVWLWRTCAQDWKWEGTIVFSLEKGLRYNKKQVNFGWCDGIKNVLVRRKGRIKCNN